MGNASHTFASPLTSPARRPLLGGVLTLALLLSARLVRRVRNRRRAAPGH